ncbi:MAG: DHH family phosphoesterase [Candidatus Edwardsbacteria bacterium]|nr:DHH family phosphoesterase [Candidatus Edwardsbacteria bacterium]
MSWFDTKPASPRNWPSLVKAAAVIAEAVGDKKMICIWGHDDLDGAVGTAILYAALRVMTSALYCIPPKGGAQYGLDRAVIDKLIAKGVGLIVTVDCGISNAAEAEYARSKGLALVITDHHELPDALPQADAVVNPKIREKGAPFADLSGSGVSFCLSALISGAAGDGWMEANREGLAWAALATISDKAPLLEENRTILKLGLPCLAEHQAIGAIAAAIGLDLSYGLSHRIVSEHFVALLSGLVSEGFVHPTVEMLDGKVDPARVRERWISRLEWRAKLGREVEQKKGRLNPERESISVIVDEQLSPDMIGPLAGRLRDACGFPVVVIGFKNGLHVGECRGFEPFDFTVMLKALAADFVQAGGHKQAAGFTVKPNKLGETLVAIEEYAENRKSQIRSAVPKLSIAYRFNNVKDISELFAELTANAPYGPGNPEPVCEIAGFIDAAEAGASYWLDDLIAKSGKGSHSVTASLDVTHTGKISLRVLS